VGRRRGARIRRFVIGTAGHIDHGKTALVKALTGVDTDRWEEEKRRGITIDLGFAPLTLSDDIEASIVDVPGHEGFVRNMLAGATGIDVALLVVAADEGVMPQTEEHLAIVELLGVRRGIPVLTKRDLVDADWLALVEADLVERLRASRIAWGPPLATSAVTGEGVEALRGALQVIAADLDERPVEDLFRLPVDRVFARPGAGTVVTGSSWSGTIDVGDKARLLPLDREVRVRSIQVHGSPTERALPGRRTALALVGVERAELDRGVVVVTGEGWAPTGLLDVDVELLPGAPRPLTARTRVRVHLGTAVALARAAQTGPIPPGAHGRVRLVLESPLVARGGDRFVLRSYSPVTTIGGGVVLDPLPPRRPRLPERHLTVSQPHPARLEAWLAERGLSGVRLDELAVRLGALPGEVSPIIANVGKGVLGSGEWLVGRAAVAAEAERVGARVADHHRKRPLDPGMSLEALRSSVNLGPTGPRATGSRPSPARGDQAPPGAVVDLVIDLAVRKKLVEITGGIARRPGWQPALDQDASEARRQIARRLEECRWQIPTVSELERDHPAVPVRALLAHLMRENGVEQVDQERFATPGVLRDFESALRAALEQLGAASPADLRDRLELTRKYLIPLLEWADRRGITERQGDVRVLARLTGRRKGT
jgi:selenocysteine-specific elongation factor